MAFLLWCSPLGFATIVASNFNLIQKSASDMENKHSNPHGPDPLHIQDVSELSLEELAEINGGSWSTVAFGATALGIAAGAAASFPGTWAVPFAGAAMVATSATMGIVAATAGYFAGM